MSELDDKLAAIEVHTYRVSKLGGIKNEHHGYLCRNSVDDIKQAFIDEEMKKWGDPISEQELKEIKVINYKEFQTITGQEWYDRFRQLLKDHAGKMMKMGETFYIEQTAVIKAAKRASGIEEIK